MTVDLVERKDYLDWLWSLKDKNLIKVLTGVRRVGKSTLLDMHADKLVKSGVQKSRVLKFNFEDPKVYKIGDWYQIYEFIASKLDDKHMNYVFLDEIQNVKDFERLIDGLHIKKNVDLYITGSNAFLLSSELSTILTGRAIEKNVLPLSFSQYLELTSNSQNLSEIELFGNFINYGGIPEAVKLMQTDMSNSNLFLNNVLNAIIEKDIYSRQRFYNEADFSDVTDFVFDSIGSVISPNSISKSLKANGNVVDAKTVRKYLQNLTDSFLLYKAKRFDTKGKKLLESLNKYYIVDPGFRYTRLSKQFNKDIGHLLENAVYLELLRRYPQVNVGKVGENEIDFVTMDFGGKLQYFQVCYSLMDTKTLEREMKPLYSIKDSFPKTIITLDPINNVTNEGIKQVNAKDWFLER